MTTEPRRQHSTLSSVRNAARLLKEFGRGDREIGVTELSRRLGIGKSTAHRLLSTLADERLLEQDPHTGAYRLGLAMYELGASVALHTDLHEACSPVLDQLRNATRETVQVAVLDGREVVYVERRESPQTLRLFGRVGHRNSAHCTSTGKVLLAALPPEVLEATLHGWRLERKTPYTITDPRALRSGLEEVRHRGWAENIGESELGAASIAAAIRDERGDVVAALSIVGPVQRLGSDSLRRFARPVVDASLAVSRRLGYRDARTRLGTPVGKGPTSTPTRGGS
ncbi:MAG: IclR family transcriptional regulator [Candidatus Nanopelagicales bacterium]|jgi:IclR family transcriptional regulator, KDG regulon repressor|nr:IclR family transcriptional regulator [Candidatus Nanopelagicales bacterium]MDP4906600.1 IclR family transcriptional regulator [Candidatus Nanopelagicales bacterium]MDP5095952.1 IclR family transcriptional regulator [Candidatus Nanopelagicales bacterium]